MDRIKRVSIVGMGAMGILYGDFFANALGREQVTFLADSDRTRRYRNTPVYCNGRKLDIRIQDGAVPDSQGPAGLLIFAVKATALEDAISVARNQVGRDTVILSVLNGITSEGELAAAYGTEHVLYCVAQGMDAVKDGPAVTYRNMGKLLIGSGTGARTSAVDAAAALLLEAGVPCEIHEDILYRQWSKLMLNVGLNQVCAVYNVPYRGVQHPGTARDTMLAAIREAQALAAREGVTLTDADISAWMKMTDALNPDGMPSMRQDTLARRPTEVELFAGAMRRLGEKHSVPTPVNDMLYRRIAELEAAY